MTLCRLLNSAWMLACRREWGAFQRAIKQPAVAQGDVLRQILRTNVETQFGRRHNFASITDVETFQRRVPAANYDAFRVDIERIASGERNVLTAERVRLLEPTSGSTTARKLIPYTASLRQQFQRMIAVWVYDLMSRRPALRGGRAYWSISPALGPRESTSGGIPIGFDDDASYLGGWEQWLVRRLLVVPATATAQVSDASRFQYATLLSLLRAEDLALISVWSPTFLLSLVERLDAWRDRLCDDLDRGADPWLPQQSQRALRKQPTCPVPRRDRAVKQLLKMHLPPPEFLRRVWPKLGLISCWTDASAGLYVGPLRDLFPSIEIQPKGLLSTEGCVSLPLLGFRGAALALRSHFLEFEDASAAAGNDVRVRLAHELQMGRRYGMLLTTGGGLYRYRTGDIVEVVGFSQQCPLVTFCGRAGLTSDLAGEKLNESHVRTVVERILTDGALHARFALVVPVMAPRPHYRLYLQLAPGESLPPSLSALLEQGLRENPHYAYAADLYQLAPCEVRLIDWRHGSAWSVYEQLCLAAGQKAGQIKPALLAADPEWSHHFAALVDDAPASRASGLAKSQLG